MKKRLIRKGDRVKVIGSDFHFEDDSRNGQIGTVVKIRRGGWDDKCCMIDFNDGDKFGLWFFMGDLELLSEGKGN